MNDNISHIPVASKNMTAEQALQHAIDIGMKDVLICGYTQDGHFVFRSSRMTNCEALWLTEAMKAQVLKT